MDLPCGEAEWLAGDTHDWSEHRKQGLPTPSFAEAFHCLVSPSKAQVMPCSSFGRYIMLSAVLQNIWHLRQACIGQEESAGLSRIAYSLQKWQAMGDSSMASLTSLRSTDGPMLFNSAAMLPVAYIGLCVSSAPIRAAARTQNPGTIANAITTKSNDVQRSKASTTAAMYAIRLLNTFVRIGINLIGRTTTLVWSVQLHLHSFECCESPLFACLPLQKPAAHPFLTWCCVVSIKAYFSASGSRHSIKRRPMAIGPPKRKKSKPWFWRRWPR
jgi:hypothetical protein